MMIKIRDGNGSQTGRCARGRSRDVPRRYPFLRFRTLDDETVRVRYERIIIINVCVCVSNVDIIIIDTKIKRARARSLGYTIKNELLLTLLKDHLETPRVL